MEEKAYFTITELAAYLGVSRATAYNYMTALHITAVHFAPDKRVGYIALADAKRLKAYKEAPWTVQPGTDEAA